MMKAINILENKELEWSETDLPSISDNDVSVSYTHLTLPTRDVV